MSAENVTPGRTAMVVTKQPDDEFLRSFEEADTPDYGHEFEVIELWGGKDKIVECRHCAQSYDNPEEYVRTGRYCSR